MTRKFHDPGTLNQRVMLEAPTETPDGCGGVEITWAEMAHVWAAIDPLLVSRTEEAQQIEEFASHRVTLRFRPDVASGWRIIWEGRSLEILSVADPDERKAYLTLRTREAGR